MEHAAKIRSRPLHGDFFRGQVSSASVPMSLRVHIHAGIIRALGQVPAVDLSGTPLHRNRPLSRAIFLRGPAFRGGLERKDAADSVLLPSQKSKDDARG